MYSMASDAVPGSRGPGQQAPVSTTTLLNGIHNIYLSSQPYKLDAGTSLVVNTWLTASQPGPDGRPGGTVDAALAARAWEHARRRAEDGCIVLGYVISRCSINRMPPLTNLHQVFTRLNPLASHPLPLFYAVVPPPVSLYSPRSHQPFPPMRHALQPLHPSPVCPRGHAHAQPCRKSHRSEHCSVTGRHRY